MAKDKLNFYRHWSLAHGDTLVPTNDVIKFLKKQRETVDLTDPALQDAAAGTIDYLIKMWRETVEAVDWE